MASHTSPSPKTMADCAQIIEQNNIHTVECIFTDTWGMPRGKRLPVEQFLSGAGFAISGVAFSWNFRSDVEATPWFERDMGAPDMKAVPDLHSFRIAGWEDGMATVMCDMVDGLTGEPVTMDGRGMLKKTLASFQELGYKIDMATELEFHLFNDDWTPISDQSFCYSMDRADELEAVIGGIRHALERSGIEVEASNVEYGPSQVEINLKYDDAMTMVDKTILFRHIVRRVARQHNLHATFMAKPLNGGSGSGMHVHMSVTDLDGKNLFAAKDSDHAVHSDLMRKALAGIMQHNLELQIIAQPTQNDYKRIVDYSFSPTQVSWGLDNRLVGVRCITQAGPGTRIEVRWAAADSNPYLVAQGYLQAALDGLRNDYELQPQSIGDVHQDESLVRFASSMRDSLSNFSSSAWALECFGKDFVENFTVMQENEMAAFAAWVTDWETQRYRDII
jgi:glutamine synthetase